MRILLATILALVAGCATTTSAPESTGATVQADGVDAGPAVPECNGDNFRFHCNAFEATAHAAYGVLPSCTGTPFLPTDGDGGVAFRPNGQVGCTTVGATSVSGEPHAICCP